MKQTLTIGFITSMLILLSACQEDADKKSSAIKEKTLVTVNGGSITDRDLQVASVRIVGAQRAFILDDNVKKKILESMVMSRVISGQALKEIDKEEQDQIERKTRDYREELLVKSYLRKNVDPQPITQEMVKDYYEKNPELFGAKNIKQFELITTRKKVLGAQREQVLAVLNKARKSTNWKSFAKNTNKGKGVLEYRTGKTSEKLLNTQLQSVMINMKTKDISRPVFIEGKPYIVRISKEKQVKARPLTEVSTKIRRMLAPQQLKNAIKIVSEKLMKDAKVEYVK